MRDFTEVSSDDRYAYAVRVVRETGELWLLSNGEDVATQETPDGLSVLFAWPHQELAAMHATGNWADLSPYPVPIERLLNGLQGLRVLGLFTVEGASGSYKQVGVRRLRSDLSGSGESAA